MKNIFFMNIDTQNDFVNSNGKLPVPEAESIKPILAKLTSIAKENNIQVVNTCDWHDENTEEISSKPDFITTFPEHCMENTIGAEFIDETKPEEPFVIQHSGLHPYLENLKNKRNIVLRKDKFDIFSGSEFSEKVLKILEQNKVIVYGVASNVCVNFAVLGLIERGKEVYVVSDAIKGLPGIESPINKWIENGVKIISLEDIENLI